MVRSSGDRGAARFPHLGRLNGVHEACRAPEPRIGDQLHEETPDRIFTAVIGEPVELRERSFHDFGRRGRNLPDQDLGLSSGRDVFFVRPHLVARGSP